MSDHAPGIALPSPAPEENPVRAVPFPKRFHVRVGALYIVAALSALLAAGVAFYRVGVRAELDSLRARLQTASIVLADTIRGEELSEDASLARINARFEGILARQAEVASVYILRPTERPGQLVYVTDRSRDNAEDPGTPYDASELPEMLRGLTEPAVEQEPVLEPDGRYTMSGYAPIRARDGRPVALVGVDVTSARVDAMKRRVLTLVVVILGVSVALLAAITALLARWIRRPLALAVDVAAAIARGLLSARARIARSDEFGVLGQQLDKMATGLGERELIRETFGRYVSKELLTRLTSTPAAQALGGEECEVSVLFCDLRGYSTLSEHLPPTQVVGILNTWYDGMMEVVDAHGGWVSEILGDGLLVFFGTPSPLPDHARAAAACAVAMRGRMDEQNRRWDEQGVSAAWRDRGVDRLSARFGVHTGRAVAGNVGGANRRKFAVIGDTVNVAASLEALNKQLGTEILITDAVHAALSSSLAALARDQGEQRVKGRNQAVRVWSL